MGILVVLFLIGFFSVYPLGPSLVFAQDDAALFEELEQSIPKAKPPDNGSSNGSDEALFDELENNNSAPAKQIYDGDITSIGDQNPSKKEAVPQWMEHFSKNFEGSLRLRSFYFFQDPENQAITDKSSLESEVLFKFASWSGTDDFKLKVSGWAEAGTLTEDYQGRTHWLQNKDNDRHYFELNEAGCKSKVL